MDRTIRNRLLPQLDDLLQQLLTQRDAMMVGGVRVFDSGDKFLPGKIAAGLSFLLLDTPKNDPRFARYLAGYRSIADMTVDQPNDSWGIYYYMSALYKLKQAGLLNRAVSAPTLAKLRRELDWRTFIDPATMQPINLPNNYIGVAFSIARLRMLMGWEDASASEALLKHMIAHYRAYSGRYGFADETNGEGRFDRYSVLLAGEIAQRFIETGMKPTPELKGWLKHSADLMLLRLNETGEGWEYGRSIGPYGETCFLEVLTAAAKFGLLTPEQERMAYAFSSRVAARYADFWIDPATRSVNMWDNGRRTDDYRSKHRILGENLSLARQYIYTNDEWNDLGFRDQAPAPNYAAWLKKQPPATFTWFVRGEYDRGLLTVRDRGHVFGLPLINGADGQHMHNPYFPIPYSPGMLSGAADAGYPLLVPRITLADGSVLMPLVWFKQVRMTHRGSTTTLTYRVNAMDRMGGNDPVKDTRLTMETRYIFTPGAIERQDQIIPSRPIDVAGIDIQFAGFAPPAKSDGHSASFDQGDVSGVAFDGAGPCQARAIDKEPYQAPNGTLRGLVSCHHAGMRLRSPYVMSWRLTYRASL